jgi:hypothetical protein
VFAGRVVMRPVDDSTLIVVRVLAAEFDHIADAQGRQAWRDVDVVGDEQGLTRGEPEYEALMTTSFEVIAEDPRDGARVLDLDCGLM